MGRLGMEDAGRGEVAVARKDNARDPGSVGTVQSLDCSGGHVNPPR